MLIKILSGDLPRSRALTALLVVILLGLLCAPFLFSGARPLNTAATICVYIVLVASAFSLFGFILGIWADGFEKLSIIPMLVLTPLPFLGGTFYSISMLKEPWQTIAQFNPVFYLVNGLREAFDLPGTPIRLSLRTSQNPFDKS